MSGNKYSCPNICPGSKTDNAQFEKEPTTLQAGSENPFARPYVPGAIKPPEPKSYPPDAPPLYLPQIGDGTSGDQLGMGPVGPWAAGHVDWSPHAGCTGTRPVVDKYSITRYSTGEWRKNNQYILTPRATDKSAAFHDDCKQQINDAFETLNTEQQNNNSKLKKRVNDLTSWQDKVNKTVNDMAEEINTLDKYREKLKSACQILMLPEAISRECLELRTQRYEPDLVRDDAEQELIKEVAIVGEIRRVFNETLAKVENQMLMNKAAKVAIESDWSDKDVTLKVDKRNLQLSPESTLVMFHPGVARYPENSCSLEYWEHFCAESLRNCEEVRKKSEDLRASLMTILINGGRDLRTQADRTDTALAETVATTEALCAKLEDNLKDNLQKIADIENLMLYLQESIRKIDEAGKTVQSRLHARNYDRPNVENCRDEAQFGLMHEAKVCKETAERFTTKLREADAIRAELMKYRGDLEKEIACKRKSLNIDRDRFRSIRAFFPSAEEFAP